MLPVFANLYDITAELVTNNGGVFVTVVGNALVVAAFDGSLVSGHTNTVGYDPDANIIRANFGKLYIIQPQIHFTVNSYCFGVHNYSS
jgi:hypothetical protein